MKTNVLFENIINSGRKKESMYYNGFKKNLFTGNGIFGLVKDIKEYTKDMDRDEAIENAVYAAVDYVKDGNI